MDWFAKAWALLHDPPYKAIWPLGFKPLGGTTHEEEARRLLDLVLQGTKLGGGAPDEKTAKAVQAADMLASSFDRWALAPEGEARYWVKPKELVNPFNPALRTPLEIPAFDDLKKRVEIFARKVNEAVKAAGDEREAYFALYAAYELAWIDAGLPALPADTRMPTHTIFDHLYATAAVLNWIDENGSLREDGCLLEIDIPGIQSLISSARKAGDYRAGSFLISLAVWGTAWRYMEKYGPDVLLSPSPRFNPFHYLQVFHYVKIRKWKSEWGSKAYGLYTSVLSKALGMAADVYQLVEHAPVIPGTAYLALPSCDEARRAVDYFEEVLDDIKATALGEKEPWLPLVKAPSGDVLKIARAALDKIPRRYLPLRVRTASIAEVRPCAEEAAKEVGERVEFEVDPMRFIFWALLDVLRRKPAVPHAVYWFGKGGVPRFAQLYDGPWMHSTLDPDQPAVLRLSGVFVNGVLDYDDETKKVLGQLGVQNYNELKKVFKPKEALGPVDVLRRALYYGYRNKIDSVEAVALRRHYERGYFKKCDELRRKVEEILDGGDAELLFGSSEAADKALAEAPKICDGDASLPPPTLMYAIVRADADNIGKLISGCLPAAPQPPDADVEGDKGQWEREAERFRGLVKAVKEAFKGEVERVCGKSWTGAYVVPSPVYYAALSASMMVTALKDVYIAMKHSGEVVFAGGDDLLAFAPMATAFDLADESRRAFWGDGGFHKLGAYVLPALAAYGKSYSIRAAHAITDFMAHEVNAAADLLEKAKDAVPGKDALAVSTSTGHAGFAKTQDAKLLKEIAEDYRTGKLSRNLPYDLERAYPPDTKCQDEEACLEAAKAVFAYVAERNMKSGAQTSPTDLLKLLTNLKDKERGVGEPRKAEETPRWKTADLWKNAVELLKALREWA